MTPQNSPHWFIWASGKSSEALAAKTLWSMVSSGSLAAECMIARDGDKRGWLPVKDYEAILRTDAGVPDPADDMMAWPKPQERVETVTPSDPFVRVAYALINSSLVCFLLGVLVVAFAGVLFTSTAAGLVIGFYIAGGLFFASLILGVVGWNLK